MLPTETSEVIPVSGFEEISVDSILRAYRRQETSQLNHRHLLETTPPIENSVEPAVSHSRNISNFTFSQDENLLNVARENNLDELIKNVGNEVISTARTRSASAQRYSRAYKICEGILRALIAITGIASAAMSISGLNAVSGGKNIEETFIFVIGIIIVSIPVLSEFKDRLNFRSRSTKLREFHNKYEEKIRKVRQIMVSDLPQFEALDQIYQIEMKLNEIDLAAFDQHFSKETVKEDFVTSKHKCVVSRQNTPIFQPVSNTNETRLDILDSENSDSE